MLSLFKPKNSAARPPKPRKSDDSFDFDSFLTKVAPNNKNDQDEDQTRKEAESLLDVTSEMERMKPTTNQRSENVEKLPKELERASKKISQSIKKLVSETSENSRPTNYNKHIVKEPRKSSIDLCKGGIPKSKDNFERAKYNEGSSNERKLKSPNSPNIDLMSGSFKEGHVRKDTLHSSPQGNSQKHIMKNKFDDGLLEPSKKLKGIEKTKQSKDGFALKKKNTDLNYDPLGAYSLPLKAEKLRKVSLSESYEQYNPLEVVAAVKKSPRADMANILDKRLLLDWNDGGEYETEITKKTKVDSNDRRENLNMGPKGLKKKVVLKSQYNEHNDKLLYPKNHRNGDFRSYNLDQESPGEEDEAAEEINNMMRDYRQKIVGRRHMDDDDSSDMEAGFDEIQEEDEISAKIGEREDREQYKFIALEQMKERKGKTH